MKNNKNKSLVLLSIFSIMVLLITIIGTTYAYFSSSNNITASANLNAVTASAPSFSSVSSGSLVMNITGDKMMKAEAFEDENDPIAAQASTTLTINLTASPGTTCTYDIGYINTGDNFVSKYSGGGDGLNHKWEFEIDGVSNPTSNKSFTAMDYASFVLGTASNPALVINDATISVPSGKTEATPVVWTFTGRFYNLNVPQDTGKNYTGYFKVISVSC